jgi:hypothetical protein
MFDGVAKIPSSSRGEGQDEGEISKIPLTLILSPRGRGNISQGEIVLCPRKC